MTMNIYYEPFHDLTRYITSTPLCSTHEHTEFEEAYSSDPPDVLTNLFKNYVTWDLAGAGARPDALNELLNKRNPDIRRRFDGISEAWTRAQHTGYGEAVSIIAKHLYGIEELNAETIEAAQIASQQNSRVDERLRLLRDVANLDHVQIDTLDRHVPLEAFGQDFFLYDINVCRFCDGTPELDLLAQETGVQIVDLDDLDEAICKIFEQNGDLAIAVKSQHAYHRTLRWQPRETSDAKKALESWRKNNFATPEDTRRCLGDWCMGRIAQFCVQYDLPFKIHTGCIYGTGRFPVQMSGAEQLHEFLRVYSDTRFVLMHIAYPYDSEIVAVAKRFANVWVDLCWAWSLNPRVTSEFVRRMIHAVPANKLFAFGGDARLPAASVGYAIQARRWLIKTFADEIREGHLVEKEAIALAERFMIQNQREVFNLEAKKERLRRTTIEALNHSAWLGRGSQSELSIAHFDNNLNRLWLESYKVRKSER
ncbi:amidohydrolase family protein [Bradyrhizobium sp. UFLA05-112]